MHGPGQSSPEGTVARCPFHSGALCARAVHGVCGAVCAVHPCSAPVQCTRAVRPCSARCVRCGAANRTCVWVLGLRVCTCVHTDRGAGATQRGTRKKADNAAASTATPTAHCALAVLRRGRLWLPVCCRSVSLSSSLSLSRLSPGRRGEARRRALSAATARRRCPSAHTEGAQRGRAGARWACVLCVGVGMLCVSLDNNTAKDHEKKNSVAVHTCSF